MSEKVCKCGFDKNDKHIQPKCEYSKLGWILFSFIGMSARPVKVSFECMICGEKLYSTTDPEILKEYIGR